MKKIIIFVASLLLLSCADSKVKELEDRNKHLERRITELEKIKEQLVSTNEGLKATIVEMREDMKKYNIMPKWQPLTRSLLLSGIVLGMIFWKNLP